MSDDRRCDPGTLARAVRDQDADAVAMIARCYLDYLIGVGRCACRDRDAVDDAVQDALLSAAQNLAQYRGDGSVRSWLSRMVVNSCRCRERGRKNDPSWNQPLDDGALGEHAAVDGLARRQLGHLVAVALESLPPADRELFVASQSLGMTAPELAAELDTTPDAVRARLSRIRRRLRAGLADVWTEWSE